MAATAGTAMARGIPTARYPSTYKLYAFGVPPRVRWQARHQNHCDRAGKDLEQRDVIRPGAQSKVLVA